MFPTTEWIFPDQIELSEELLTLAEGNRFVAAIFAQYGIQTEQNLHQYLQSLQQTTPASELPNILDAVKRVQSAIKQNQLIGVWGDFDADGQTSTSILVGGLREMGARVIFHIPVRGPESHGINLPNLKKLFEQKIALLITCDTGIREFEAAKTCQEAGVDLIITDHHTPAETFPEALAIISGQILPEDHPLHEICGAGCAYKFIEALFIAMGMPEKKDMFIDLAAIGTIADLVPLSLENRRMVRRGLQSIRQNPRPALAELFKIAEIPPAMLQEEHISFQIAPRMNALGRLDDANSIVPFFLSTDTTEIRITANRLDGLNIKRKQLCENVFKAASDELQRDPAILKDPVIILHHPAWPAGINGLVASQLTERYHKPTIVLTAPAGENARGSARSIEGINITDAIASQAALLSGFGGHAMAAGLSLPAENLDAFRKGMAAYVKKITSTMDISAKTNITLQVDFSDLSLSSFEKVDYFSPFGPANPAPVFLTKNILIQKIIPLSQEKQHLKLQCVDHNGDSCVIFWWNGEINQLPEHTSLDIIYHARPTSFRGEASIQCSMLDFRIHTETQVIKPRKQIAIHNFRDRPWNKETIQQFLEQNDSLVWGEGNPSLRQRMKPRSKLVQAETLLIATIPDSFDTFQSIINIVKPQEIVLLAYPGEFDQINPLITGCMGLIKYAIKNKDGWITLATIEEYTGQRRTTILTVINILQANGFIKILTDAIDLFQFAGSDKQNEILLGVHKTILENQMAETKAFRKYFRNVSITSLLELINK